MLRIPIIGNVECGHVPPQLPIVNEREGTPGFYRNRAVSRTGVSLNLKAIAIPIKRLVGVTANVFSGKIEVAKYFKYPRSVDSQRHVRTCDVQWLSI